MRNLWTPRESVKRWDQKGQRRYIYRPGLMDRCDPTVLAGSPIEVGAIVVVTGRIGPFRYVLDCYGNRQSVWKQALIPFHTTRARFRRVTHSTCTEH